MFKLILPPHDAFLASPFWNPGGVYDFFDEEVVAFLPVPPPYEVDTYSFYGDRWHQKKTSKYGACAGLHGRARYAALAAHESREVLHHVCWILGVPTPSIEGTTYSEIVDRYSDYAINILHELVGQSPMTSQLPDHKRLILYRARRCFPSYRDDVSPLKFLSSYTTPLDEGSLYEIGELHELITAGLKGRGFVTNRIQFRNVTKNTATMEYLRGEGGFNRSVWTYSKGPAQSSIGDVVIPEVYSPVGGDIARFSHRDRKRYSRSFQNAIITMRSLKRKPYLFVDTIFERSGKRRIPAMAEGFCAILSLAVSDVGKTIQSRIFPLTKGGSIKIRHEPGSCYLSGDYKDSTNFIWWEAIMVAYWHYFKYCGFTQEQMDLYMEVVSFLCRAHVFYDSKDDRERYRDIFRYSTSVAHPNFGYNSHVGYMQNSDSSPHITRQVATGSPFGEFTYDFHNPPAFADVLEGLASFLPHGETIISVRGLAMCYSLAAPALHLIGAIPHWKFRDLEFVLTGDDNASAHRPTKKIRVGKRKFTKISVDPLASLNALEAEKPKTGMVPHDKKKSARGHRGALIAERLLIAMEGEKFLIEVKNFPIRILFPDEHTDWHAITMPEAAIRNLTEVPERDVQLRIMGFILWKYETIYSKIRTLNISIGGAEGLFPMLPETPGCANSFGKASRAEVFKLPSTAGPGWPEEAALGILTPNVTIPWEVEGGYNFGTDTFASIPDLCDRLRPFSPVDPYDPDTLNISGYVHPLIPTLRKNLDDISYEPVPSLERFAVSFCYGSGYVVNGLNYGDPSRMDGYYLASILALPEEDLSHSDMVILKAHRDGSLGYGPAKPSPSTTRVEHRMVDEEFHDECEEQEARRAARNGVIDLPIPIRAPVTHWAANFSCAPPDGTNLKALASCKFHWFIDMANFSSRYREAEPVCSVLEYMAQLGEPSPSDYSSVTYFVLERPGRTTYRFIDYGDRAFVKLPSRIAGHAGADKEYRDVSGYIRKLNPNAKINYTSSDGDWRVHSESIRATYKHLR